VPVVWDGSAGINPTFGTRRWEEGNWTKDGIPGQTAIAAMGDVSGGRGGMDIVVGSGHVVEFDFNDSTVPGALDTDFRPRMDVNGPGTLTIKEGATVFMDAHSDNDGRWIRHGIDMTLDNGTLRTQHTPALCPPSECSAAGGKVMFAYQNETLPNTILDINIINGGRMEIDGVVVFGNPNFWDTVDHDGNPNTPPVVDDNPQTGHNPGIGVNMTINGGTLDLTNATGYPQWPSGILPGELLFAYEWVGPNTGGHPQVAKNEDYNVNFTGPGQIIVDSGIFVVKQNSAGEFLVPIGTDPLDYFYSRSYQDLWALGILQANGLNGLDNPGESFDDYFVVTGTPGSPNYTLTSLVESEDADYNEDGTIDAADYVAWRKLNINGDLGYAAWKETFGEPSPGGGGSGTIPEPASFLSLMIGLASLWLGRRRTIR
jgi:hypothetical protein